VNFSVRYLKLKVKKSRILTVPHPNNDLKITFESREGGKDLGGVEGEGDVGSSSLMSVCPYMFVCPDHPKNLRRYIGST
jgi:hypothetical protein